MNMSDAEGTAGSRPGRTGQDPVTGLFLALRDAWLAAARTQSQPAPHITPGNLAPGNPEATPAAGASAVASLLTPMVGVLGAVADFTTAAARQRLDPSGTASKADASPPGQNGPAAADFLQPIGDAMLIAANRSVNFWFGLAQ